MSVVLPAYQEAARLATSLATLRTFLRAQPWRSEVLLVVEKSPDGTLELAQALLADAPNFRVLGCDVQRGKGHAVRRGMQSVQGEIAFFMDVDLSTSLEEMPAFLAQFAAQPDLDILVGNRAHPRSVIHPQQSLLRRSMGQTFNRFLRLLTGLEIRDTQCGFKAFRRRAREPIFARQQLDGFAFDVEIFLLARTLGLRLEDRPVHWQNAAHSKVRIVRDSWRMLRDVWLVRKKLAQMRPESESSRPFKAT